MQSQNQGSFTRGSQVVAHQFRMFGQGSTNVFVVGVIFAALWLIFRLYQKIHLASLYYFIIERYVQLKLVIGKHFYHISQIGIKFYYLEQHAWVYRNAQEFVHKFWYVTNYGVKIYKLGQWLLNEAWVEGLVVFIVGTIAAIIFCSYRGRSTIGTTTIRGGTLVESRILAKMLLKAKAASPIKFAQLPLVKGSETQHLLLTGTTGSGKTNMINELLPQIRLQQDRAIIIDLTGSFTNRFFDVRCDKLLNPFEEGTENWLPWNDCDKDFEFDALASAFIEGESFTDKYWEEAAQKVLSEALQKHQETKSLESLLHIIAKVNLTEFCKYFEGTFAAGLVSKEAEKGTASVRSTLLNKIERLKYLKDGGNFSIKNWVNDIGSCGWLFITAPPNQRDTLRPLVSAWIDIAIKGLMDRPPEVLNQKMWFILDELPALQKIPSLKRGLAEGRKYGGCFVAGLQNIFQMEEIYGSAGASSLLDMFNSRFFFKVGDQRTAEYAAKTLGEKEIFETRESLSYGSNTMRDGVNLNNIERIVPLVLPTEILNLPTRTCFVKLAENYPVTKLKMKLQTPSIVFIMLYRVLKKLNMVSY